MILARLEGGPLAKTGVIAGMSGSPVLHRRQAPRRRRLRLPVLEGDDRGHHAHRRDDRRHAHGARRAPRPARFATPVERVRRTAGAPRPRSRSWPRCAGPRRAVAVGAAAMRGDMPGRTGRRPVPDPAVRCRSSSPGFDPRPSSGRAASSPAWASAPVMGGGARARRRASHARPAARRRRRHLAHRGRHGPVARPAPSPTSTRAASTPSAIPSTTSGPRSSRCGRRTSIPCSRASTSPGRSASAARGRWAPSTRTASPPSPGASARAPRMIPVEVEAHAPAAARSATFSFRMVEDELFSPVLAYVAAGLRAAEQRARLRDVDHPRRRAPSPCPAAARSAWRTSSPRSSRRMQAAALVAAPLAYLMSNDFERGQRREARRRRVLRTRRSRRATLERAWIERTGPVRPGSHRAAQGRCCAPTAARRCRETIPIAIPANAPPGTYSLLVADGPALTAARAARDAAAVRAAGPRPAHPRHQRPAPQQPRLRAPPPPRRRRHRARRVPAVAAALRAVRPGRIRPGRRRGRPSAPRRSGTSTCPPTTPSPAPASSPSTVER